MNLTQSRKDYWIHLDPASSDNFMVHGRTYTEPKYDKKLGHYVVTEQGRMCNDRLTCINSIAKTFLPDSLWKSITPGKRAHVFNYTFWELKDENDEVMVPVVQKTDYKPETYFEMQQFTDHLIFGLRGKAELHERYSSFNTRQEDEDNPLKVQYVNKYGQVITHGCSSVKDAYIMVGCPGNVITPMEIARLWGSDVQTNRKLDVMLIEAYLMGIRYKEPPTQNVLHMDVKVIGSDIIKIVPKSDYYGFADNMVFSSKRDYSSDPFIGTRSLERCLIGAILAYRWFFNKPTLKVSLSQVHDPHLENESSWINGDEYVKYMKSVESYSKSGLTTLTKRINSKVDLKWEKYKEHPFFDPKDFVNTDYFSKLSTELED